MTRCFQSLQADSVSNLSLFSNHLNVKSLISGNNLQSFAYEVSLFLLDHWNAQRLGSNCAPSTWTTGWQSKFNSVGTLCFWGLHPAEISKLKWREDKAHGLVSSLRRIWFGAHLKCMQVDFKVGDRLTLNSLWSSLQRLTGNARHWRSFVRGSHSDELKHPLRTSSHTTNVLIWDHFTLWSTLLGNVIFSFN